MKWRPDFVVVSTEYKLSELMLAHPGWRLIFDDGKFKVFRAESGLIAEAT